MTTAFSLDFQAYPPPDGLLRYALIPWDSDLLGVPCYELRRGTGPAAAWEAALAAWRAQLPAEDGCLVVIKTPPDDVAFAMVLTRHGFYPVETLVDLQIPLGRFQPLFPERRFRGLRLRRAEMSDLPRLIDIAATAFSTDRFHLDPSLPRAAADRRYVFWIEQGVRARDPVFVLDDQRSRRPMGFAHGHVSAPGVIDIRLAGVEPNALRSGAGVFLYQSVLLACRDEGYRMATARTSINNLESTRLLLRLGFTLRGAVTTFHWFHAPGGLPKSSGSADVAGGSQE